MFNFSLELIMLHDSKKRGYTAFFKQFPDVIAQGNTRKDTISNLVNTFQDVLKYWGKTGLPPEFGDQKKVVSKSIDFQTSQLV